MKLWIDDVRVPPDEEWFWAKTVDVAQTLFDARFAEIRTISFDHDMGMDTTIPLAEWIEERAFLGKITQMPYWFVHSANPVGRENLTVILTRAAQYVTANNMIREKMPKNPA